jgi:hypothetical protein
MKISILDDYADTLRTLDCFTKLATSRPSSALANIRAWEMTVMTIEPTRESLHGWRKPRRRTNVRLYGTPAILKT